MMIIKKAFFNNQESRTQELFDKLGNLSQGQPTETTWTGLKTFDQGLETDRIDGQPTIAGLKIDDESSITEIEVPGFGSFPLSASAYNLKKVTETISTQKLLPFIDSQDVEKYGLSGTEKFTINFDLPTVRYENHKNTDPPPTTIEGLPFYNWVVSFCGVPTGLRGGTVQHKINYTITNDSTGESFSGVVENEASGTFFSIFTTCRVSLGSGDYTLEWSAITITGYDGVYGIRYSIRRTHYPSLLGEKIKALNSNYQIESGGLINEESINKLRVI